MAGRIAARLRELSIKLPPPRQPIANYIPTRVSGALLFVAGQVPFIDGKYPFVGKLGDTVSIADGQNAARLCAINVISQLNQQLGGDLDRVRACVRLGGFVNATPDFAEHPKVVNGASDLIVEVFGDAGRHARTAVGCGSLPNNVAVEIEAIFEIS
jgi:enamine deaminase RidA (YjgF/YER057c/UK114 family)